MQARRRFPLSRACGTALTLAIGLLASCPLFSWTHIARSGETLEQLAVRYYGRSDLAVVLQAANGFVHPDDGSVTPGERIEIPEVALHRVKAGETWASIADQYLGSPKRGIFLAKMNSAGPENRPHPGALIKLPYHIRHIFAVGDSLNKVARLYYGMKRSPRWLKQYNLMRQTRFRRGDVLLVPLIDLAFTQKEQAAIDAIRAEGYEAKDLKLQEEAGARIAEMGKLLEQGSYVRVVSVGERLLGRGMLSDPQQIAVYQHLGSAYVALGDEPLAFEAFGKAIALAPATELSAITTSPKIRKRFRAAKDAFLKEQREKRKAPAEPKTLLPDASVPSP